MDDEQRSGVVGESDSGSDGSRAADDAGCHPFCDVKINNPCWAVVRTDICGTMFRRNDGLQVIASQATELDGRVWFHVSMSRRHRMPTYRDMKAVKELFLGKDTMAYQVLPPESKHINLHEYCLHLWALEDGSAVLPDFTRGGAMI